MLQLILLAYPDRVARRRAPPGKCRRDRRRRRREAGRRVGRPAGRVFRALDAREDQHSTTREAPGIASSVRVEWLEECSRNRFGVSERPSSTNPASASVGRGRVWYRDLLLREDQDVAVDPRAGEVLAEALRQRADEIFGADESAADWLARLRFVQTHLPEHPGRQWRRSSSATCSHSLAATGDRLRNSIAVCSCLLWPARSSIRWIDSLKSMRRWSWLLPAGVASGSTIEAAIGRYWRFDCRNIWMGRHAAPRDGPCPGVAASAGAEFPAGADYR